MLMSDHTNVADALDEVVGRIVESVRPWRVVLFGSRARGDAKDHSDYDLYLEVNGDETHAREIRDRIHLLKRGPLTIDVKVSARGAIDARRDDPGTLEWDVAREGRVLYADAAAPSIRPSPRKVSEASHEPPKSTAEWIESGERDLRHRHLLQDSSDDYSPEICWLSHQMCEKYLKALLVSRWVRPKRTHDLQELLAALRAAGCALPGLDADCELLTDHAIKPRYPEGLNLTAEQARLASDAADRILNAVRGELPKRT
jgi:HEPN domain-containing protein/predicted nucleotidyltransferase